MILCAGEALIDMLPRISEAGERAFAPKPGGAVFNTSIALGRLGVPAGFFSGVSTDLFGTMLTEALEGSNVDTSLLHRSDAAQTLAFVELTDGQAKYAFYDEGTVGRMLTPADLPETPDVSACFFGGISLAVTPCADAYRALAERLSPDAPMMIDPNIRPGFITDEAAYRGRLSAMIAMADIVKLSDEDAHWLYGERPLAEIATEVLATGSQLVCMTEGAKGVTAYMPGQSVTVAAEKAQVVDTVGAGDTFNAGLLAGLHRAGALSREALKSLDAETATTALKLGAAAAAVTVSRAGANPPTAAELGLA
ncbi:carbohydrate kinase [Alphaproteobacteria bacterium KMM 3653]|uniref:Carbohydrate kinase n=1 Tax=Harenicola maris TaxID=2841044 RepID=A0AAP2CR31_9RHOB|nr:carbohydrate kinase [Harenicola maris]